MLRAAGGFLVQAEPPVKADAALVLAGDAGGHRILKGAELKEQGWVNQVWVSGPAGMYGRTEDELAIDFAVRQGRPREWFHPAPNEANSTADEARMLLPRLQAAGIRRLLLVTSGHHTRRAGRIFRATAARITPGLTVHTVAAPDPGFPVDHWWKSRPAQKVFFFESVKTLSEWFGI